MPISPEGEAAIAKLAKLTVEKGWDPGQVIRGLLDMHEALMKLTPEERAAVRRELRRLRDAH